MSNNNNYAIQQWRQGWHKSQCWANNVIESLLASEQQLQRIKKSQQNDQICRQVIQFCQTEWPNKALLPHDIQPYYSVSAEISVEDGLVLRGCRIIIPSELQPEMLNKIH